jgi:hypothetical protein
MANESKPEKRLLPGQWEKEVAPHGTLHGPRTLFLTTHGGKATATINGREETFQLTCAGIGPGAPMVRCERTGIWFTLSWEDILAMALDAGITAEHPEMES